MVFSCWLVVSELVDDSIYLAYVNFVLWLYCTVMLLYALVMYEALY